MSDRWLIILCEIAIYAPMIIILVVVAIDSVASDFEIAKRISKYKKRQAAK